MWQYGVERELVEFNPFAEIRAARSIPAMKQESRERILNDDEIKILWAAIDQGGGSDSTRRALKLMLLTGQRSGEVCGMHSRESRSESGGPVARSAAGAAGGPYRQHGGKAIKAGSTEYIFRRWQCS